MKIYILFLFVFCFNLFSYDYLIYSNINAGQQSVKYRFYTDEKGNFSLKLVYGNGSVTYLSSSSSQQFAVLNGIKNYGSSYGYIDVDAFDLIYKGDNKFLNDLYLYDTIPFMNYLYNNSPNFSSTYYDEYDYELLYNSNGLVVESIVDGVWAGLYDEEQINESGYLFNSDGKLLYYNGVKQNGINYLINTFNLKILKSFNSIQWKQIGIVLIVVSTLSLLYLLIRNFKGALNGFFKYIN